MLKTSAPCMQKTSKDCWGSGKDMCKRDLLCVRVPHLHYLIQLLQRRVWLAPWEGAAGGQKLFSSGVSRPCPYFVCEWGLLCTQYGLQKIQVWWRSILELQSAGLNSSCGSLDTKRDGDPWGVTEVQGESICWSWPDTLASATNQQQMKIFWSWYSESTWCKAGQRRRIFVPMCDRT